MTTDKTKNLYRYSKYIKLIFAIWDLIVLNSAYMLSFFVRYQSFGPEFLNKESIIMLVISNISWVFMAYHYTAYRFIRTEYIENVLYKTLKMSTILFVTMFTFLVILNYDNVSRLQIVYFVLIFFVILFLSRISFIRILKNLRKAGYNFRNVIIIGNNSNGLAIAALLARDVAYGYRVKGFFCDDPNENSVKLLGSTKDALTYLIQNPVHEVYMSISNMNSQYALDLVRYCESNLIRIKLIPDFTNFTRTRKVQIDFYDNIPVVSLRHEPLERTLNQLLKRAFDLIFTVLIIFLVFPWLFPILMIAVKLSSKGPVFFKQQRSGENNRTFWCYKFRTMRVNNLADELQATKNDSRITKIGKLMRRTNLDELPQFFNVLLGEMSVVGPRPHMLKHTREYSEIINEFLVRHLVKPGITGWAQVNGFRGETINIEQMRKRVEFDIWYIENWSFILDLKIIFFTLLNMLKGEKNAH